MIVPPESWGADLENYVLMIVNGEKLTFRADTEQTFFMTGDQCFRVVPKENSYMLLKSG